MTETAAAPGFEGLARARAILLTTFRGSGEPVGTPVWLVVEDKKILMTTTAASGKVRRIRDDPRVTVAPCTQFGRVTGTTREATARLLGPQETQTALASIRRRYGLLDLLFSFVNRLQGEVEEIGIEITAA